MQNRKKCVICHRSLVIGHTSNATATGLRTKDHFRFLKHGGIGVGLPRVFGRKYGESRVELREPPKSVTANERLRVILDARDEQRHSGPSSDIRRNDRCIAKQTATLGPCERRAAKPRAKFVIGRDRKHFNQIEARTDPGFRAKLGPRSF